MITRTLETENRAQAVGFLQWREDGRTHEIELGEFLTIGRDPNNQMVLEDAFISARHARLERKSHGYVLRDLRSRNGTLLNGSTVYEGLLDDGDRIRIGQREMIFVTERSAASALALTSKNEVWEAQLKRFPSIANSPFPVLLTGPSGTGKDVLAHAVHRLSSRRHGPFISVNCSALSEALVESELFGHVRGSFTGATNDRKGAFEAARGGTLFLDEIGDLPLNLQPKLLRALENNQIRPVGSDRPIETDVRIIAATHHDLKRLVMEGSFRSDLYFRLHVIQMRAPGLTERLEDFEDLLYQFAREMRVRFSFAAIQRLKAHSWPGNIRELKNAVARAKAFGHRSEITENDVSALIDHFPELGGSSSAADFKPSRSVIKEIESEMIKSRLIANRGNQRKTASDLGLPKSTLHDRIRSYGIDVDKLMESLS